MYAHKEIKINQGQSSRDILTIPAMEEAAETVRLRIKKETEQESGEEQPQYKTTKGKKPKVRKTKARKVITPKHP